MIVLALLIWIPRGFGLERFVATDEVAWLWRSANFYYSLGQRDLAATDISRSPGVVTMWVNTAAFLIEFPAYRGLGQGWMDKYWKLERLLAAHQVDPHDILVTGRTLMALLNTFLLALAFRFARRLFGGLPALTGFLLIAFDPYHIALTRLAHLDGPQASFMFLSLLAFLAYLYTPGQAGQLPWVALLLSAAAAGLAVLAKIPGFLILPTVGLLWLAEAWSQRKNLTGLKKPFRFYGSRLVKPALAWGAIFLLTVGVFFPAMWVQPFQSGAKLLLSPFGFAGDVARAKDGAPPANSDGDTGEATSGDAEVITGIAARPLNYFLRYPEKYLWHASPATLLGLAAALAAFFRRKGPFESRMARRATLALLLFALIYTIFMTIPPKSSAKYYLPVYPVLDLIAGAGWVAAAGWAAAGLQAPLKRFAAPAVLAAVILVQAAQALPVYPYFLTYLNPLMAASPRARLNLSMGSGEGLDQAAAYLNAKPRSETLQVIAWYGGGPFSYYFHGRTVPLTSSSNLWDGEEIAALRRMDYLVVYSSQWGRQVPGGLFPFLAGVEPEKRIYLNGIEYVRIYNVRDFPIEKFQGLP